MKKFAIFNFICLSLAAMAASAYFGFRAGEKSVAAKAPPTNVALPLQNAATTTPNENAEQDNNIRLTPEQLAKEKGVPAVLPNQDGEFTLMSVIEGTAMNQRLTENLQLVVLQRQQLASLAKQFDEAPGSAVQQRELIAGQINEVRNALNGNQQFMAQNYGYTFDKSYVRVPHKVSLVSVEQIEGKTKSEVVHDFQTAETFAEFQKKNDDYLRFKMELAKASETKTDQNSGEKAAPTENIELPAGENLLPKDDKGVAAEEKKVDPKMEAEVTTRRDDLIKSYHFDPERQYSLQYHKTAFYAKTAQ